MRAAPWAGEELWETPEGLNLDPLGRELFGWWAGGGGGCNNCVRNFLTTLGQFPLLVVSWLWGKNLDLAAVAFSKQINSCSFLYQFVVGFLAAQEHFPWWFSSICVVLSIFPVMYRDATYKHWNSYKVNLVNRIERLLPDGKHQFLPHP